MRILVLKNEYISLKSEYVYNAKYNSNESINRAICHGGLSTDGPCAFISNCTCYAVNRCLQVRIIGSPFDHYCLCAKQYCILEGGEDSV